MPTQLRLSYRTSGTSGELAIREESPPPLAPGEVCIAVKAISLNYRDLLYIDSVPQDYGLIPGSDAAGIIEAIGSAVTDFQIGDRVTPSFFTAWTSGRYHPSFRATALGGGIDGVYTSHIVTPASCVVRIDDSMSFREAATLPCAAVTAWNALIGRGKIQSGESVLIQGTGGVSLFATQIALAVGATPIVLTGSSDKIERLRALGVECIINYKETDNWETSVSDYTGGNGADHVIELLGNSNLSRSAHCLRPEGTISYVGCLAGFEGAFDPLQLMYKNANLHAIYVGSRFDLEHTARFVRKFGISPVIDPHRFCFNELAKAVAFLRSGKHFGKVVVEV